MVNNLPVLIRTRVQPLLSDLFALFFPACCHACSAPLWNGEKVICTACDYYLPATGFHNWAENPVSRLFWGRVDLASAAACYSFQKGGAVQQLMHHLKYKGYQEIGVEIGRRYGKELRQSTLFQQSDLIVPVPLHARKLKMRGFNQSECFARGLSESLGIPVNTTALIRIAATETQTRKSRFSRWKNVESGFALNPLVNLQGKHILLVDDVVTTGATLEACAGRLLEIKGIKVSIAAIAVA
jgi:ComF family protein